MTAARTTAERIKAARGARRDTRDADVVLDQTVSEQVDAIEDRIDEHEGAITDLEAEKERIAPELRFSDPRPAKADDEIAEHRRLIDELESDRDRLRAGTLLRLRFEKMDGEAWAAITSRHPARIESTIDQLSGYDYHATAREAAPLSGWALGDDDAREDLTPEDWKGIFEVASGREFEWIASALWELNDFGPRKRIGEAKKASAGGSGSRSS